MGPQNPQSPNAAETPEVLTTEQAAALLGCSTQFLEIARCKGGGPPFSHLGRRLIRYRKSALLQWLEENQVTSTSVARNAGGRE